MLPAADVYLTRSIAFALGGVGSDSDLATLRDLLGNDDEVIRCKRGSEHRADRSAKTNPTSCATTKGSSLDELYALEAIPALIAGSGRNDLGDHQRWARGMLARLEVKAGKWKDADKEEARRGIAEARRAWADVGLPLDAGAG